jgi:hypothetical protein
LGKTANDDVARAERSSGSVAAAIQSMKSKTPAGIANGRNCASGNLRNIQLAPGVQQVRIM